MEAVPVSYSLTELCLIHGTEENPLIRLGDWKDQELHPLITVGKSGNSNGNVAKK